MPSSWVLTWLRALIFLPLRRVQLSHSVMSDSFWPHGLQHARLPCLSPTPGACWKSCPSSRWCHPIISSSLIPFSSCLQFFPASGSFPVNQFFASGGQSIGASASVLPMNIQDWFILGLTGLISQSLLKLISIELVMPFNHLFLCQCLLLLPSIFSSIRVFSNESTLHIRWRVLEFQIQHQFFQWTPRTNPFGWTGWILLHFKGLSRVFSNTTVQKYQFLGTQLSF